MSRARVIVVDDDWFARQVYSEALQLDGHDVVTAGDGAEALEHLGRGGFDLLVTDVIMPGIDGLELLERSKALHPETDAIVMTSLGTVDTAIRALRAGAYHYLVKPVDPEALQLEVRRCLTNRRLVQENQALRRYVQLFQTSQRLAASLDRDRLHTQALDALQSVVHADAALFCVFDADGTGIEVVSRRGLQAAPAQWLATTLLEHYTEALTGALGTTEINGLARFIPARDPQLRTLGNALVVPLRHEDRVLASIVLLRHGETAPFTDDVRRDAAFLSDYAALALDNCTRYVQAQNLAWLDGLTGLHNARYLEHVLDRELARRHRTGEPFSVLFLDLDHFKRVNDQHGHRVGSALLTELGRLLRRCVREEDVLVRYGGDEFVAVILDARVQEALGAAERIRRTVEAHRFLSREGLNVHVTVCVGVATFPLHAQTKDEIIHRADMAMYHGKHRHRNATYVFDQVPADPEQPAP